MVLRGIERDRIPPRLHLSFRPPIHHSDEGRNPGGEGLYRNEMGGIPYPRSQRLASPSQIHKRFLWPSSDGAEGYLPPRSFNRTLNMSPSMRSVSRTGLTFSVGE